MLNLFVAYPSMMRWAEDATKSAPSDWNNWGYGMMGNIMWPHGTGLLGWGGIWMWLWSGLCLITWFLVVLVLVALFRWLWKKGEK